METLATPDGRRQFQGDTQSPCRCSHRQRSADGRSADVQRCSVYCLTPLVVFAPAVERCVWYELAAGGMPRCVGADPLLTNGVSLLQTI